MGPTRLSQRRSVGADNSALGAEPSALAQAVGIADLAMPRGADAGRPNCPWLYTSLYTASEKVSFLTDVAVNPIEDASRPEGAAIHDLGKDATQFAEISKKYGIFLTAFCFEWAST